METARYVGRSGADGIKLQLLHVLEGTDLAQEYREGKVPVLTLEEYIQILEDCLSVLPPRMVIHRLTGDGDKRTLLAPSWSANKSWSSMQSKLHSSAIRSSRGADGQTIPKPCPTIIIPTNLSIITQYEGGIPNDKN